MKDMLKSWQEKNGSVLGNADGKSVGGWSASLDVLAGGDSASEFHFVTQNASFRLAAQIQGNPDVRVGFNTHPVGILWNESTYRPAIFNEDGATMLAGIGYNVRHATGI